MRIAPRTQAAGQVGKLEGVPAEHVDVMPHEEAGHVLVTDVEAVRTQLGHRGVHVPRVELHECVVDQAQGADLVFHAVLVALVELPGPAMEDLPGEGVATLLEVRVALDLPPVAGLVGRIVQEHPEEPHRGHLHREPEPVVCPPLRLDQRPIRIVQEEEPLQLRTGRRPVIPRVLRCLLIRQRLDRHPGPPDSQ